jgi:glycosyltransferase involved in cell wall biosynthesis
MNVALNCWGNIATGLGSEARWLWKLLPFDRWLYGRHPLLGDGDLAAVGDGRPLIRSDDPGGLDGVDVLVCIERGVPRDLPERAKARGIRVVMLANAEWSSPAVEWWEHADLVVARTDVAARMFRTFGVDAPRLNVPIALDEFPFTERHRVGRVRFTNGWGGVDDRKGWPEVRRMLELGAEIEVYSQREIGVGTGAVARPADVYAGADAIIMPSRFEGVGLTALEAMASGALVLATGAPPMSEWLKAAYPAWNAEAMLLPIRETVTVCTSAHTAYPSQRVDAAGAAHAIAVLRQRSEDWVAFLSAAGRRYVEVHHGAAAADQLWARIVDAGERS